MIYRIVHGKREQYFQFDQEAPKMNFKEQLEAVQEVADDETDTGKQSKSTRFKSDDTTHSKGPGAKGKTYQ